MTFINGFYTIISSKGNINSIGLHRGPLVFTLLRVLLYTLTEERLPPSKKSSLIFACLPIRALPLSFSYKSPHMHRRRFSFYVHKYIDNNATLKKIWKYGSNFSLWLTKYCLHPFLRLVVVLYWQRPCKTPCQQGYSRFRHR